MNTRMCKACREGTESRATIDGQLINAVPRDPSRTVVDLRCDGQERHSRKITSVLRI